MSPTVAIIVVLAILVLASVIGLLLRRPRTRQHAADDAPRVDLADILEPNDATVEDTTLVVQFSTVYCTRCPALRRALEPAIAERDGLRFISVDLTDRIDLADRFGVRQTPTVLVIDRDAGERARFAGQVHPTDVLNAVDTLTREDSHVD